MVGTYSSGMKQRLLIARALLSRPSVLLLDEPTRSLDPVSARDFRRFLREEVAGRQGCTVMLATHDADEALELCDRLAVLHRGRLVAQGTARELAGSPESTATGSWSPATRRPPRWRSFPAWDTPASRWPPWTPRTGGRSLGGRSSRWRDRAPLELLRQLGAVANCRWRSSRAFRCRSPISSSGSWKRGEPVMSKILALIAAQWRVAMSYRLQTLISFGGPGLHGGAALLHCPGGAAGHGQRDPRPRAGTRSASSSSAPLRSSW